MEQFKLYIINFYINESPNGSKKPTRNKRKLL